MPRPDSASQQARENMGQEKSRQHSGEINITGNTNETRSGSHINSGVATNTPITGKLNIKDNNNKTEFASFINSGLCDPEVFDKLWGEVKRNGSESDENDRPFFAAAGKNLNILLVEAKKEGIPEERFFSRVSEIVREARREHPQPDRVQEIA
ncbi:hypothetical protein SLS63_012914 [Diaporthe eres]|uniref:Uncharacterized protein n=1 Tax=Diaporthe eres TaxID=83184 RepID=A0ABR1NQ14_DIAER